MLHYPFLSTMSTNQPTLALTHSKQCHSPPKPSIFPQFPFPLQWSLPLKKKLPPNAFQSGQPPPVLVAVFNRPCKSWNLRRALVWLRWLEWLRCGWVRRCWHKTFCAVTISRCWWLSCRSFRCKLTLFSLRFGIHFKFTWWRTRILVQ